MVGAGLQKRIAMRCEVFAKHPLKMCARDDVKKVRDHAIGDKRLAHVVEVESPGIGGSVRDRLEGRPGRMIPPDAAVDCHSLLLSRARLADPRIREDSV